MKEKEADLDKEKESVLKHSKMLANMSTKDLLHLPHLLLRLQAHQGAAKRSNKKQIKSNRKKQTNFKA